MTVTTGPFLSVNEVVIVFFISVGSLTADKDATFTDDHDLVRLLTTERARVHLSDLDGEPEAAVAIPIFQGNALTGFALYGTHRGGTSLDPDEVETLENLCEAAAQAYTLIEISRYRSLLAPAPA